MDLIAFYKPIDYSDNDDMFTEETFVSLIEKIAKDAATSTQLKSIFNVYNDNSIIDMFNDYI